MRSLEISFSIYTQAQKHTCARTSAPVTFHPHLVLVITILRYPKCFLQLVVVLLYSWCRCIEMKSNDCPEGGEESRACTGLREVQRFTGSLQSRLPSSVKLFCKTHNSTATICCRCLQRKRPKLKSAKKNSNISVSPIWILKRKYDIMKSVCMKMSQYEKC